MKHRRRTKVSFADEFFAVGTSRSLFFKVPSRMASVEAHTLRVLFLTCFRVQFMLTSAALTPEYTLPVPPVIIRVLALKIDVVDSLVISFIILCYPLIFRCSTVNVVPMSLSESRLDEAQKINTRL